MNESVLRNFCESRYRRLIVIIGTLVLGLAVTIPLVDDYFDNQESHAALTEELVCARQTTERLPQFREKFSELNRQVAELEARSVGEASLGNYRSQLVEVVRESGCQMRRITVSNPSRQAWLENDTPLRTTRSAGREKPKTTPFVLERHSIVLAVDGTTTSLNALLEHLQSDSKFVHPHRLTMNTTGQEGTKVTAEIELWLFALTRASKKKS